MHRPIVLCFVDYYLPGFRGGGPTRTIANLVEMLGDEFDIRIVTRDHDFGTRTPLEGVRIDGWNRVGKASVYYASARTLSPAGLQGVINDTEHDAVYLNSFLSPRLTVVPLLLRRLGRVPRKPWILAPRGEFAPAALAAKALKKRAYLLAAKAGGLYRDLTWRASAQHEADDIRSVFGTIAKRVLIAPDLPRAPPDVVEEGTAQVPRAATSPLRLVFLSRLAPVKNLDFLLDVLATVRCEVEFAVHGLKENEAYWQSCEERIAALPGNVRASYRGAVMPDDVPGTFARYDLFAFPSRGENFGHVVLESLSVGTPVLVSDRTPWQGGESDALEVLPIERRDPWRDAIERWGSMTDAERRARREAARGFALDYIRHRAGIDASRRLFLDAMRTEGSARAHAPTVKPG